MSLITIRSIHPSTFQASARRRLQRLVRRCVLHQSLVRPTDISAKSYSSNDRYDAVEARFRWCDILTLGLRSSSSRLIGPSRMRNNKSILHAKANDAAEDQKERDDQRPLVRAFEAQCHTSNENKTSDGGRGRASSIGVDVWKSSQKWSVQWSAVRSIAWLGLWRGQ